MKDLAPVLRLFWQERKRALIGGAVLMTVTLVAGIALLGLSGWFITATAIAGLGSAALAFDIFLPGASIRFLALGRTFARYGERLVTHDATLRVLARLREKLFRGYALPEAAGALRLRPARLLFRLTTEVDALDSLYLRALAPVASALVVALLLSLALWLVDPGLAWPVILLLVPAGVLLPWWVARAALRPNRRRALALEALRARVVDLAQGQADLVMAGRIHAQAEAVMSADSRLAEAEDALNRIDTRSGALLFLAGQAALVASLLISAALVADGALPVAMAAFAMLAAFAGLEAFAPLRRGALELGRAWLAARRLGPRLRAPAENAPSWRDAPEGTALRLTGVTLRHPGAARPVLRGLDLHVAVGECVALVGESGAGKSSVLAMISGELSPESGDVCLAPGMPRTVWMSQHPALFQDSLRGNLLLAAPDASDDHLHAALEAAGFGPVLSGMPEGLDTRLGEGGFGLSSGQTRRLALARALLRPAPLWLLDEPTEGLDHDTAQALLTHLQSRLAGHSALIVTHLRREAALADRILLLRDGQVKAEARRGDPDHSVLLGKLRSD